MYNTWYMVVNHIRRTESLSSYWPPPNYVQYVIPAFSLKLFYLFGKKSSNQHESFALEAKCPDRDHCKQLPPYGLMLGTMDLLCYNRDPQELGHTSKWSPICSCAGSKQCTKPHPWSMEPDPGIQKVGCCCVISSLHFFFSLHIWVTKHCGCQYNP